ncbi:IclR family transcriptional regulator [Streptomyces sp. NPDC055078]
MQSVLRSLRVLEAVADHQPVGVNELSRRLDLPPSTVQRILVTLRKAGWLEPTDEPLTRWTMTTRALAIGLKAVPEQDLLDVAAGPMRALRDQTQEAIHLWVPDQFERMILVDKVESEQQVRAYIQLGGTSPIHVGASGRCVLAALPDDVVEDLVHRVFLPEAPTVPFDRPTFDEAIAEARKNGYSVNTAENRAHVCAIAAAVRNRHGRPVAAIAISVPSVRFDFDASRAWGPMVVATAEQVGVRLIGV